MELGNPGFGALSSFDDLFCDSLRWGPDAILQRPAAVRLNVGGFSLIL